jgi:hypothetical protein
MRESESMPVPMLIHPQVDTLMTATGRQFVDQFKKNKESWRHSGTVVLLKIQYTTLPHNADGTGSGIPYAGDADGNFAYSYTYQATPINGTDFKAVQYVASADGTTRTVYNRHGIKIYVVFGTHPGTSSCHMFIRIRLSMLLWLAFFVITRIWSKTCFTLCSRVH